MSPSRFPLSHRLSFQLRLRRARPVLVFQMGKVGSTSIVRSLGPIWPGVVAHDHAFLPGRLRWPLGYGDKVKRELRWLHDYVYRAGGPLDVISLTREPIARNISSFFQSFRREAGTTPERSGLSPDQLIARFLDTFPHDIPLAWFQMRVESPLGIDVFAEPFADEGAQVYENGRIRLLVLRCELPDDQKADAIGRFLGLHGFTIRRANVSAEKSYADTYRAFLDQVRLPPVYVEWMCGARYTRHFYPPAFIENTRQRWLK